MQNILNLANFVLEKEIEGVASLKNILDENFFKIVQEVANCKGKIVISGVGKSGHIGKKISSTMCSIGIESVFLHPTEASHGDLGVLNKQDLLILISNSGETKEFAHLISYLNEEKIKKIAITRSEFSTLANSADFKLVLPKVEEVVSYGAPTTSTTQTLAIGDVLSICASKLKSFTDVDYGKIHPGGKLGISLKKINSIMRKHKTITIFDIKEDIKNIITQMNAGFAIITSNKKLVGILTDGDLRRGVIKYGNILEVEIEKLMTKNPITLNENDLALKAIEIFNERKIGMIIILNSKNEVSGAVDRKDIEF